MNRRHFIAFSASVATMAASSRASDESAWSSAASLPIRTQELWNERVTEL